MMNVSTSLSGEYKLVITRGDGSVEETEWMPNIILDSGLDKIGATSTGHILYYARVGTGNSTPVAGQLALDAQIAASGTAGTAVIVNEGAPLYRTTFTIPYTFAQGAVVGNVAEIGIGWTTTGTSLFSRALIVDNVGTPTTITLVAIDQLTVYYRLRINPVLTDATGSVTISGTPYSYTARIATVASFANAQYTFAGPQIGASGSLVQPNNGGLTHAAGTALAAITGTPGTQSGTTGTVAVGTYSAGSFFRDDVWSWGATQGNATGGIQLISFPYNHQGSTRFQVRFDNVIPKTNTNSLSLTVRISWNRV